MALIAPSPRAAIVDDRGTSTYDQLLDRARRAAGALGPLAGRRVALLVAQDADWVVAFLGTLLAGGVAVPLSPAYPPAELAWFCDDSGADTAIVSAEHAARAAALAPGRRVLAPADLEGPPLECPQLGPALILYTSGTTGRPKGAILSHANLATQAALLRDAWGITAEDRLLHALPLHHLHGICVALVTALAAGASVRMLPRFDAARVVAELPRATVWMAVPTMYHRLREHGVGDAACGLRLATSGSAALPVSLASWWRELTGAIPLERFGMTEVGIACSNPLDPAGRRPGSVGRPLPTVETQLVDGELWLRGPSVFAGYHARPGAPFTDDGWFRTGDVAEQDADGYVRLLGRTSVDILKSGGEKISALEIEEVFREHPAVAEVAVVGVPDERWGERVVAAVVACGPCDAEGLRAWCKERLASYKVPRQVVLVDALPRNAMGKVMKPELSRRLARA